MSAESGKHLEDKVVILGRVADDYYIDDSKLNFLMGRLSSQPSSNVVDLTTRKSGLDFLIEYSAMVQSFRKYSDFTYISSKTVRELLSEGYDLELDGLLILITTNRDKTEREQIESLKALGDKYPLGFSRFKPDVKSQ